MRTFTPLRYPGGKSCLYDTVKKIITSYDLSNKVYVEPFSGGFGLGLKLMINGDIKKFIINDIDWHIYAFWKCVFFHSSELIEKIRNVKININEWRLQKKIYENYENFSLIEVGFSTLFLNRTNYSGILKSGPIGGFKQTGKYKINCRFNKETLIEMITYISQYKSQVKVYNKDAIVLINQLKKDEDHIFYNFDPPYVKKGKELYYNFYDLSDHENLHNKVINLKANWIITYDNNNLIRELYKDCFCCENTLIYSVGSKRKDKELLISNFYRCD